MKKAIMLFILTSCIFLAAGAGYVLAADDADRPPTLICAISNYYECNFENGCQPASAADINAPQFFKIMLDKKVVTPLGQSPVDTHESKISTITRLDNIIVLQSVEDGDAKRHDGVGWSASISIETGKIVLTASGLDAGFVGTGACAAY